MRKLSELEEKINQCDSKIIIYKSIMKDIKSEKTKLLQLLSEERNKIINIKKGDEFEFYPDYFKIDINKKFNIRCSITPNPIKIKITDTSNKYVDCMVINGDLLDNRFNSYTREYILHISKKTLLTLLNDKSTYGDIINRHKVIEEILNYK